MELPLRLIAMVTQASQYNEAALPQLLHQLQGFCAGAVDEDSWLVHKLLGPRFVEQASCICDHWNL